MASKIFTALDKIGRELAGIKNVLMATWEIKNREEGATVVSPDFYADEYISVEECAKRLNLAEQTIRNWMSAGKKNPDKGWREGVHYVNVNPDGGGRALARIPWNHLIQSFGKNRSVESIDFLRLSAYAPQHNKVKDGSPF